MRESTLHLVEALGLPESGSLTSIVGGGGKSALLFALAGSLEGRVVMTTTTRIFASQIERASHWCTSEPAQLETALRQGRTGTLVVGEVDGEKALGVPTELPARLLLDPGVDHVVVEADGSRMRPVKAPADHEPVVPAETTLFVVVAGIDALEAPIAECAHRPERVCALLGVRESDRLTPELLATLLGHPEGGLRKAPGSARVVVFINKVECDVSRGLARTVAERLLRMPRVERVVTGSLEGGGPYRVHSRV